MRPAHAMDRAALLLFIVLTATVAAAALLVHEARLRPLSATAAATSLQGAVGGLGIGAVTAPTWNFRDYDPRLQQVAEDGLFPIPGGPSFAPERMGTVSFFPDQER